MTIINNNVKCADRGVIELRGITYSITLRYNRMTMTTVERLTHMTLGRDAAVRLLLYTPLARHTHNIIIKYQSITEAEKRQKLSVAFFYYKSIIDHHCVFCIACQLRVVCSCLYNIIIYWYMAKYLRYYLLHTSVAVA